VLWWCLTKALRDEMRFDEIKLNSRWCFFLKKLFILLKLINLLLFLNCVDVSVFWIRCCVFKNFEFFFIKIEYGLYVLDRFDVLMLKIIFKK
jgi:hypothetical protein